MSLCHANAVADTPRTSVPPISPNASPTSESFAFIDSNRSQHDARPSSSSTVPSLPRVRKRVPWRGKTCIISLPPTLRESEPKDFRYLTRCDVDKRLHDWQAQGHNVGGFQLGGRPSDGSDTSDLQAQTRPPFPDPVDIRADREKRSYRTKIPDRAQWDSYVNDLREAKLRALGVTFANDNYGTQGSPVTLPIDRHSSSRASQLLISPSLAPPRSADILPTHVYSKPTQTQDTPGSSSCTSPVMALNSQQSSKPIVSHFPRYSIAESQRIADFMLPGYGPPPTSPVFPLQGAEYSKKTPLSSRITRPAYEGAFQRPDGSLAPKSKPLRESNSAAQAYPAEDLTIRTEQQQVDEQGQILPGCWEDGEFVYPSSTAMPMRLQPSEIQKQSHTNTVVAKLHNPVPRTHRECISETLERHLHEAEDNPLVIRCQPGMNKALTQLQSINSTSNAPHTNLRESGSVFHDENKLQDSGKRAKHQSHSASGLNALAPEFKSGIAGLSPSSSMAGTTMRPTAPAFTPIAAPQAVPVSREFSFSSAGPSFRPNKIKNGFDPPDIALSEGERNGLFSTVSYPLISKPVKKSKAVPILRPRDMRQMSGSENEVEEDESGRITQAEGRQKRLRRSSQGANQDSRYTLSSQAPSSTSEQHPDPETRKSSAVVRHEHVRQDSLSLEKATQAAKQLKEIIDGLSASEGSSSPEQATKDTNSDERALTIPTFTEAVTSDDPRSRSFSTKIKSSRVVDARNARASPVGSLNEQSIACGSIHKRVSSSPTYSSAKEIISSPHTQPVADSDTLRDSHRKEFSRPFSDSITPAPDATAGLLRARSRFSINSDKDDSSTQDPARAIPDGLSYIEPSYKEIDAVLKHLDDEGSMVGTKDNNGSYRAQNAGDVSVLDFYDSNPNSKIPALPQLQDNAQSPSSSRGQSPAYQCLPRAESESVNSSVVRMVADNARFSPSYRPSHASDGDPRPFHGTGSAESAAISEWDNAFSSSGEARIHDRGTFLDARVNEVVANTLQVRLAPLERCLAEIQRSLVDLSRQSSVRSERLRTMSNADTSDADDEDDVESGDSRTRSSVRHRNIGKIKMLAAQIVSAQHNCIPASELTGITDSVKELKTMLQEARPSSTDVKLVVEEAIGKQMRGRSGPITSSHQSATAEKNQLQITGLESMLKIAEGRAEDELKARRSTEDALADSQRLLRLALQDAAEQRESAEETERSLSAFHEEQQEVLRRNAMLEGTQESLRKAASELAEKNVALEGTLEEYRLSSTQWRDEIESAKIENTDLRRTVSALKAELEDGIRGRQALRAKFDQLQGEMTLASQNIAEDQSLWRRKEEEYKARCEVLVANYERESERCAKMETEIAALSKNLRVDRGKLQQAITEYERESYKQREEARLERERMQKAMDNDRKAAMHQLNDFRIDLSNVTAQFESQLDQARTAARTENARYERMVEEAAASTTNALQNQQNLHDQVVKGLTEQHEQSLQSTVRERRSIEVQYSDRLALADEKLLHYQDKIQHLEEKLEIAKSAAQAAVQAVQSNQPIATGPERHSSSLSNTLPEKISPQALRESIFVLQEQLQDRESQIEQLEQKLSMIDVDAPAKVKAQQTEITWLHELFDVRIDDLRDLITALAEPAYDREAIKDAAIRLKANLEMEQQEKERAQAGARSFPPVSGIANLTSSPRSLPLAAAAAWGNWRKGRSAPILGSLGAANGPATDTPSRSSPSTQSILSGLLTPPRSDIRRNARLSADLREPASLSFGKRAASSTKGPRATHLGNGEPYEGSPPMTPSLTRTVNYDMDAMTTDAEQVPDVIGMQGRSGDGAEIEETFGLPIAAFPGRV
ncbi:MAG: hypothetical protein Q9225_000999 [Loekoesia sp. 1 TL-2023]